MSAKIRSTFCWILLACSTTKWRRLLYWKSTCKATSSTLDLQTLPSTSMFGSNICRPVRFTLFPFFRAGYMLHSAIHLSRPDIKAVIHLHHPACVAVSAMKQGLLICCQEAAILGPVSYHDYRGLVVDEAERESIARDLGPNNKVSNCFLGDGCTEQWQHMSLLLRALFYKCPRSKVASCEVFVLLSLSSLHSCTWRSICLRRKKLNFVF